MTGNEHIEIEDLAMFALFLLGEEESESVQAHINTCAACREEYIRVSGDLALYAQAIEPAALPEGARDRFADRLNRSELQGAGQGTAVLTSGATPGSSGSAMPSGSAMKAVPGGRAASAKTSPVLFTLGWAGWAVAAAVAVVALGLHRERDALRYSLATQTQETAALESNVHALQQMFHGLSGPAAVKVSLTVPKAQATPAARATYDQSTGTLLLQAGNMAPLPAGKVYELWLIPADGKSPIPAGTFQPDAKGNANLLIAGMRNPVTAKAFGITVEHAGGSSTPTLPIVLAGAPG